MLHVGFTGTQAGMTKYQQERLRGRLVDLKSVGYLYFHHGDCIGADAQAHDNAKSLGFSIVVHPPLNQSKRAFKVGNSVRVPLPYLDRNQEIVNESDFMIAAPKERTEQLRSGTWATVRRARVGGVTIVILQARECDG